MENDQGCTVQLLFLELCNYKFVSHSFSQVVETERQEAYLYEAGFNDRLRSHDLVACSYASAVRLGLPPRLMIWLLIMRYYFPFLGFGSFLLTTRYIIQCFMLTVI